MYGVICFIRITVVFAAGMVSLTIGQNCPDDYSRVEPYNSENAYYNSKEACIEECFADTETFEGSSAQFYERQDEEKMRTSNVWKYLAGSDSDDEQTVPEEKEVQRVDTYHYYYARICHRGSRRSEVSSGHTSSADDVYEEMLDQDETSSADDVYEEMSDQDEGEEEGSRRRRRRQAEEWYCCEEDQATHGEKRRNWYRNDRKVDEEEVSKI